MNAAEIRETIKTEYEEAMSADKRITKISGKAKKTYKDASTYASRSGTILGRVMARSLIDESSEETISKADANQIIPPALRDNYKNVCVIAQEAQEAMNEEAGVGLAALTPAFDDAKAAEIVSEVVNGLSVANLVRECENASRKIVDDSMKVNAEAHSSAGLKVTVTRNYDGVGLSGGRQCEWCLDRCGTDMPYGEAFDKGAFQRHPGCGCELLYKTGKRLQRQTDWTRNQWEAVDDTARKIVDSEEDGLTVVERIAWANHDFAPTLIHFDQYQETWADTHFEFLTDSQKDFIQSRMQTIFDNSEYHMAITEEGLEKVLDSGRFKSIIEIDKNDIMVTARKAVTEVAFGCDESSLLDSQHEVYGYLGNRSFANDAAESTALSMYGDVIVRFKKDSLEKRVTYTYNDSYGMCLAGTCIAGNDGKNVSITGIEALESTTKSVLSSLMVATDENLKNPNRMAHSFGGAYIELQYHGTVGTRDIESICFTEQIRSPELITRLKDEGIRVYHVDGQNSIEL